METENTKENIPLQDGDKQEVLEKEILKTPKQSFIVNSRWYDLSIQVIAIFLSITLSFAVNQCQENRKNKELEAFYLKQILIDLEEDTKELEEDIEAYQYMNKGYIFFQNYNWEKNTSPDSIKFYAQIFFIEAAPNINNLGFETLKSTGKLDIISDKKILTQLIKIYQEQLPSLNTAIELYYHSHRNTILPYLIDNLELSPDYPNGNYIKLLKNNSFRMRLAMGMVTNEILQRYQRTLQEYLILKDMVKKEIKKSKKSYF
ncbi:MAG: hypothetical protein MUE81_05410 [Thermoflexibacter sp.]|jgi:hypothetical protein|nr:hypothetical protein [Thermoflexibacter sp.]